MTINELIKKTPLDVLGVAHIVESELQDTSSLNGQIRQIAETNKQVSQLLNTLSCVPLCSLLTTIGTQGNAANLLALGSLQQTGALDTVTDIVSALSIVDVDDMRLFPAGRKTKKGLQSLVGAIETVVDLVPLSAAAKLAIKGTGGYVVGALIEFAPEIGDLVFEGFRAIEYELIELVIDKIFRANAQPGDNTDCCLAMYDLLKSTLLKNDKSVLDDIAYAIRQGLVDFPRDNNATGESETPSQIDSEGKPVFNQTSLIWRLMDAVSDYKVNYENNKIGRDGNVLQPGVTPAKINSLYYLVERIRDAIAYNGFDQVDLSIVKKSYIEDMSVVLSDALLKPRRDVDGSVIVDGGKMQLTSRIPERLEEYILTAFLRPSKDSDGQVITDSQGRPVYESVFSDALDLTILKKALLRPILDSDGQPVLDDDGEKTYGESYLLDIVAELASTTEVWSVDGLRLFLRERVAQYTETR